MIYRAIRPLLFRMDAENAHNLALSSLAMLSRSKVACAAVRSCLARPANAVVDRMGLRFPHPVGLAAGMDKNARVVPAWFALGFGFVELGTVTPLPQPGHDRPRMFRLVERQALVNRMGFNNDGAEIVAARLGAMDKSGRRPPFPIGISVGKNAVTPLERATDDYVKAAAILSPHADFISMNVSSPNTSGLRELQSAATMRQLVEAVIAASNGKPVLVKLAPEVDGDALRSACDAILEGGATGIIATNTLSTAGDSTLPQGGLSGRPLCDVAWRRIATIRKHAGGNPTLIGCGGISDRQSAQRMLDEGADLVQVYSALVFRGPFLAARLSRQLHGGDGEVR